MERGDADAFREALDGAYAMFDKDLPSDAVTRRWWEAFRDWPIGAFKAALAEHEKRSRFAPKPADLFAIRESAIGRLTADEAWALALRASDEANTVVWTQEAAIAFSAASDILQSGDKVGARMAFKAAYERACLSATGPVQWQISLGYDEARREGVLTDAVERGQITHQQAARHIPLPPPSADGLAIAGLLTGKVTELPKKAETLERLAELKRAVAAQSRKREAERREQIAKDAEREFEHRALLQRQCDDLRGKASEQQVGLVDV